MSAFLAGVHHIQSKIEIEKSRRVVHQYHRNSTVLQTGEGTVG